MPKSPKKIERPNWDEYFINIMDTVAERATCDRGRSGCVITRDNRIIATGYVGAPPGLPHCDEVGHQMIERTNPDGSKSQHCVRTAHAEENTIVHAARFGVPLKGATLYCNMTPCYTCAKMVITAGIERLVVRSDYHGGKLSKEMFIKVGIQFELLNEAVVTYEKM
jgi:dCMP deaminase